MTQLLTAKGEITHMPPMFIRRMIHDMQERRSIVREARTRIGELAGNDAVIEVGCGFGPNSVYCRGPYLGIDISPDTIREAKRRHPTVDFLCGDVGTARDVASSFNTILFCAVMHELPDYTDALKTFIPTGIKRIIICDYDPALGGPLRFWMKLFEPDARRWWGCQPGMFLPVTEWSFRSGRITPSLLWWEFRRKQK